MIEEKNQNRKIKPKKRKTKRKCRRDTDPRTRACRPARGHRLVFAARVRDKRERREK